MHCPHLRTALAACSLLLTLLLAPALAATAGTDRTTHHPAVAENVHALRVASLTPAPEGGQYLTLEGRAVQSAHAVYVEGAAALSFSIASPTRLLVFVPAGLTRGQITVHTAAGLMVGWFGTLDEPQWQPSAPHASVE